MKKKDTVLVFGITSDYVFALINTLIGLVNHNKKFWDDIIVYYDEINECEIKEVNNITPVKFIKFDDVFDVTRLSKENLKKYSVACLYKFMCFELLKKYKKVIWNDVDILIQGDISGLLDYANETGFAATASDNYTRVEANFNTFIENFDMLKRNYNTGILVFSDKLKNYDEMFEWCIKSTNLYAEKLRWLDQAIINLAIQNFKIDVEEIDIIKYCCWPPYVTPDKDVRIVHAYGEKKFWNNFEIMKQFPEWNQNNLIRLKKLKNNFINNKLPLVSIALTVYDRTEFLDESIKSILSQTYNNLEFVIVIDKSDKQDKIEKIIKSYNDDRIKIIKNKTRLGLAKSLNVAIDNSNGVYIARMDDDDISFPRRIEMQVKFLEKNKDVGLCGTSARMYGKNNFDLLVETNSEILKVLTLIKTPVIHPSVMFRKSMLNQFNLRYDSNYYTEDYELWSRCIKYFKIANIKDILLIYRNGTNDSLTNYKYENKIHSSHLNIIKKQLKENLNYDASNDELEMLQGRRQINYDRCYNLNEYKIIEKNFFKKLISLNEKSNFYSKNALLYILKREKNFDTNIIRKFINKFIRPIYNKIMNKVEIRINDKIYVYNEKVKNIEDEIKEIKQKLD